MLEGYQLVWADEFTEDGALNPEKWGFDIGPKWHNNELQAYTDRAENAFVKDGMLHIRALKETFCGRNYTSARIHTYGKASWKYGYFEIRGKIPNGVGSWPAFWFMPDASRNGVRWPLCGEIDMMEHTMAEPDVLVYSLHSEKINHMNLCGPYRSTSVYSERASQQFRTYGMEWTPEYIAYLLDGEVVCRYDRNNSTDIGIWPYDQPFYLILNIAVGGFMGGPVREADLPYEMLVDYVRVYQKEPNHSEHS